jgi:hypothetical protein
MSTAKPRIKQEPMDDIATTPLEHDIPVSSAPAVNRATAIPNHGGCVSEMHHQELQQKGPNSGSTTLPDTSLGMNGAADKDNGM